MPRGSTTEGEGKLAVAMREFETEFIRKALRRCKGNVGDAAEDLGIHRRALERKMEEYELRGFAAELRAKEGTPGPRAE